MHQVFRKEAYLGQILALELAGASAKISEKKTTALRTNLETDKLF